MLNESPRPGRWRPSPDLIASLILVGAGILFFSDFLFSSKNFYFRDILNFHYPLRRVLIDSYSRGEFPLWNPFIYLGQPMLANPNYMAFYPTNLLHLFLPFNYAFKLHFVIHPILAGLGAFFLMRRLGIGCVAALTGALAYEFSGTVLSFLNLYNLVPTVALLPWIGWAFWGALQKRWLKRSLLFGSLLALQIIAFEPLLFQCVAWMLVGLATLYVLESEEWRKALLVPARVGAVGVVFGLGLAAVQVLPTLELLPRSARTALPFSEVSIWSMHPLDFLNALIPNLFGHYYTIGMTTSWGGSIHYGREGYLVSFFLGAFLLVLAALSFVGSRKKLSLTLSIISAISIFLACGKYNPAYQWLYQHLFVFKLGRYPSKYFLLTTLAICVMASLGAEVLFEKNASVVKRRRSIAIGALFLAGIFIASWICLGSHPGILEGWLRLEIGPAASAKKNFPAIIGIMRQSLLSSGIFLLIGGTLVLLAPRMKGKLLLSALMPVLIAAELVPANLRLSPLISEADFSFVPEVNRYITQLSLREPFRVVPPNTLLPSERFPDVSLHTPNNSLAWLTLFYRMSGQAFHGIVNGISYSLDRSVDYLNTREADVLWGTCAHLPESSSLTLFQKLNSPIILSMKEIKDSRLRLLSNFDTRTQLPIHAYWLDNAVKRAYFASGFDFAGSQKEALRRFLDPDFPVGNTVILEGAGEQQVGRIDGGTARIVDYKNSSVICDVDAKMPGYLVLLDSYYPGWIAVEDGMETQILRANYAFRAVQVPAGRHRIEFRYRPATFYIGLAIAFIFLASGSAIGIFGNRIS